MYYPLKNSELSRINKSVFGHQKVHWNFIGASQASLVANSWIMIDWYLKLPKQSLLLTHSTKLFYMSVALPLSCRYQFWMEAYLTNGKVKTSNVLEVRTARLDSQIGGSDNRLPPRSGHHTPILVHFPLSNKHFSARRAYLMKKIPT